TLECHNDLQVSDSPASLSCRAGTRWPRNQRALPCRESLRRKSRVLASPSRRNQASANRCHQPRLRLPSVAEDSPNVDYIRRAQPWRDPETTGVFSAFIPSSGLPESTASAAPKRPPSFFLRAFCTTARGL